MTSWHMKSEVEVILQRWDEISKIKEEKLPAFIQLDVQLDRMETPKTLGEIGTTDEMLDIGFLLLKDIRDKYMPSRLACDLGILDELLQ